MVLPTLHSYSLDKHLTTSQPIMQERAPNRLNSAHSKWLSPISGILSDEAQSNEQKKQEKSKRLEQRRSHLSSILEAEKNQFQNELISIRQSSHESIPKMKTRDESLRSTREEERQVIADDKLHEYSITNSPDLRSVEQQQQQLENFQSDYWSEQLNENRFVQEEYHQELCPPLDEDDKQEQERQKRIEQLKFLLQKQMNQIKQKEQESEILNQEEEDLIKEQEQLNQYQQQRKQMETRYVQQDSGRQLLRQHKAKLHKRAKQIQEQLEFDIKILESINHNNERSLLEQSEKRDTFKIFQQFQQQIKLEKEKEQLFYAMYPDEAAKQWSHHEQEWNHQKESREILISQILDERQEELMEKLQLLKEQQQQIDEKQQALITDMEQTRKYYLIQKQKQAKEKEQKKQISIIQQERIQSRLELEKERDLNQQINQLVQKQKSDITNTTVQPKFYGRRRVNWN